MAFYTVYPRDIQNICHRLHPLIADIREPDAYRKFHMRGAVSIPYSDKACWVKNFSGKRPVLLYCEYGSTSLLAARRLGKEGIEVYTVIGGARAMRDYRAGNPFNN